MKTISLFLNAAFIVTTLLISSCNQEEKPSTSSQESESSENTPLLKFDEESHDFGTITQGEKVSYSFTFTNPGNADLIISSATGSCGCTVPNYPKNPIKAGESGKIDVVFDSEGKSGIVEKSVTVVSNATPRMQNLRIKSTIIKP